MVQEICRLKSERNAVILAHNYQLDDVQAVADYVGDSFYLSKIAAQVSQGVIVFCGVKFMAETAKVLSPTKTVLLPELDAGCPLADTITEEDLAQLKKEHPGVPVVCYINSSTAVKAQSDVCCTSANAVKVVAALPGHEVIFVPDQNLGHYVAQQLPGKHLILWPGACVTHAKVKPEHIAEVRRLHPDAPVLVHPECAPPVVDIADFVGSTSRIIEYAEKSPATTFIIGTEMGVLCSLRRRNPHKKFYLLTPGLVCPNMKKTRLASVYRALAENRYEIQVDEDLAARARKVLDKMLELA